MCIKEDKRNLILIFDCWLSILSIFQNSIFQLFCSWHLIFTNNSRGECGIRTNFNLPGAGGGGNSSLSVLYRNIQVIIHFTPPLHCLPSVGVECLWYLIDTICFKSVPWSISVVLCAGGGGEKCPLITFYIRVEPQLWFCWLNPLWCTALYNTVTLTNVHSHGCHQDETMLRCHSLTFAR